ncbi:MAG: hypothetical protein GY772_19455 [bacterium]|nr:hypothetical protein [bacterium]
MAPSAHFAPPGWTWRSSSTSSPSYFRRSSGGTQWRWPSPPDPALPPVQEPPPSPACERVEADAVVYAALDASGQVVCQLCCSEDFAHLPRLGMRSASTNGRDTFSPWRLARRISA